LQKYTSQNKTHNSRYSTLQYKELILTEIRPVAKIPDKIVLNNGALTLC